MRVKGKHVSISYDNTKEFFSKRARVFNNENPYGATMYQDNNKELVDKRNLQEIEKILPLLKLDENSIVFDIACGVGRWADAISNDIKWYYGVDFNNEFIDICKQRIQKNNFIFSTCSVTEIESCVEQYNWRACNRVIIAGILIYLNDNDVNDLFAKLKHICQKNSIIYVREPVGITERLTLKEYFSEELETRYSAIYRTRDDYVTIFSDYGFSIKEEGYLFNQSLNNREETAQYYFIIENL